MIGKKSKHLLVENELNKLQTFDSSYFIGKSHFEEGDTQNYLVFQSVIRYFKVNSITNTDYISSLKSKGLPAESINPPTKFNESCLQQSKVSYTHSTIVNIYNVYELGASGSHNNDPTLMILCLFDAVTLTKNTDINKYVYSGYGIGIDRNQVFHFQVVDLVKMYYFLE